MRKSSRAPTNSSAMHIFEILRLVSRSDEPLGTAEISRLANLPLSTVYRALVTLDEARYISRSDPGGQYQPGEMPQHLSHAVFQSFPLRDAVQPLLERMAQESGETTSLSVRIGWYQMTIAVVHGFEDLYHRTWLGAVEPLHRGIASQAILAYLSDADRDEYLRFRNRRSHIAPPPDEDEVRAICGQARRAGYLSAPAAADSKAQATAIPLRDSGGCAVGSILITGHREDARQDLQRRLCLRDEVEARLRDQPDLCRSPYAHLDPNEIEFHEIG